jgi:ankyrin repeat protein
MKPAILLLFLAALLATETQDVRAQEPEQIPDPRTPLMRAAEAGHLDDVRSLLKAGVNVNEKLPTIGLTALMLAAGGRHLEVVKVLLDAGADPNAAGGVAHGGFYTPLTMAMDQRNKNRLELIDTLIGAGAKLNPASWFPESPLFAAVNDNDIEMMNALLKRGSDVNWENDVGTTALVTAITMGEPNVAVVRLLLNAGADPNKPRLWIGDDCVSIRQSLEEGLKISRDKVREEILRLVIQAGGRKYSAKSNGKPCKP